MFINISTLVFKVFPEANRAGLIGDSFNLARYGGERERDRDRETGNQNNYYFQCVNV